MDAEARKAAKARYRAAMTAAQNGRRLMLRDMEQYKAGIIDLQGIQVPTPTSSYLGWVCFGERLMRR